MVSVYKLNHAQETCLTEYVVTVNISMFIHLPEKKDKKDVTLSKKLSNKHFTLGCVFVSAHISHDS